MVRTLKDMYGKRRAVLPVALFALIILICFLQAAPQTVKPAGRGKDTKSITLKADERKRRMIKVPVKVLDFEEKEVWVCFCGKAVPLEKYGEHKIGHKQENIDYGGYWAVGKTAVGYHMEKRRMYFDASYIF